MKPKIGIIAGNRKFPCIFAKEARDKGYHLVAVGIKGDTSRSLKKLVDKMYWLNLSEFRKLFEIFKKEDIKQVIMAGQISPRRLFSKEVERDEELRGLLAGIKNKKADTIFSAIAKRLESDGLELIDSTMLIDNYLPKKSILTKIIPDNALWEDINFGLELAKAVAGLDIGQTVAVKEKAIIAVEAFEGTDNLIRRAGKIIKSGLVVVKVSKPNQDRRFDIPVVGLNTIKNLIRIRAKCLAIEAGKTLFIDQKEAISLADRKGLVIVAV